MTVRDDGGAAFPRPDERNPQTGSRLVEGNAGMTLRDWFAGQATIGMHTNSVCDDWSPETMAIAAYRYADAMLAVRVQP